MIVLFFVPCYVLPLANVW